MFSAPLVSANGYPSVLASPNHGLDSIARFVALLDAGRDEKAQQLFTVWNLG